MQATNNRSALVVGDEWGFTGVFDRDNGGGFLTEHFPGAAKAVWHFDGIFASSRHIPGACVAAIHMQRVSHAPFCVWELPCSGISYTNAQLLPGQLLTAAHSGAGVRFPGIIHPGDCPIPILN